MDNRLQAQCCQQQLTEAAQATVYCLPHVLAELLGHDRHLPIMGEQVSIPAVLLFWTGDDSLCAGERRTVLQEA